jgi:hypothetical protein
MGEFLKKESDRVNKKILTKRYKGVLRSTNDRTIAIDNSMSASDINDLIDLHKHIPYGQIVTFSFSDGTYNLTDSLVFSGFYGGGALRIYGNTGDNSLSTTKNVFLDFNDDTNGIDIVGCSVRTVLVRHFKIRHETDVSTTYGIRFYNSTCYGDIRYNYLLGKGTARGANIYVIQNCRVRARDNYVDNVANGIYANEMVEVYSYNNDDNPAGTQPATGLLANAAHIYKNGTQPAGSVNNESTTNGGVIA